MAAGDRIILGLTASSAPVLQPGSRFSNKTYGLDDGRRTFLVHPQASTARWPRKATADADNPNMYVVDVTDSDDESGLIKLEVTYSGIAGAKPNRVSPDTDIQLLSIPVLGVNNTPATMLFPMPQPTATNEYVTAIRPTLAGVGSPLPASATWMPAAPPFSLTYTPDPSKIPTYNYYANQWVLQSRGWQEIVPGTVWFVREKGVYYYQLASA